jgi:regulator of protease activity HflC (stomatin/prohibitin superfamily)
MGLLILFNLAFWGILGVYVAINILKTIQIVPNRTVKIVERLGKFNRKLEAGFHILIPWVDRITYTHDLREQTVDVPAQQCFTLDNVRVIVDGVMYIQVVDPLKASYGVNDYRRAAMQLALTTSRAIIATLDLDRTFEERDLISARVVDEVARAGQNWGIQVLRYEIKAIEPPDTVKAAMEMQVTAERNRRAIIHKSEGDMQSRINRSEGMRNELVARSDGERQRIINEAQGRAREIEALAEATAASIEEIAEAISYKGGDQAVRLRLSEAYIDKLRGLARNQTQIVLPADLTSIDSILSGIALDSIEAQTLPVEARVRPTAPRSVSAEVVSAASGPANPLRSIDDGGHLSTSTIPMAPLGQSRPFEDR